MRRRPPARASPSSPSPPALFPHAQSHRPPPFAPAAAFRRCVREIASSNTLQLVTNVEAVHKKFGYGKYRTKLGFGLHFGWSVEGPVGTPMKIDCSYLSPEVKISDRLEAATKIYSSNILMSGQFYDLLSDHMKVGIRLVDHITLKGGHKPFRIYACDRSNLWLKINPRLVEIYGAATAYEQFSKSTRASTPSSRATGRRRGRSSRAPPSSARTTRRRSC